VCDHVSDNPLTTDESTGVSGENVGENAEEIEENAAEIASVPANWASRDRTTSTWGISHQSAHRTVPPTPASASA
jgi:hypothetical protein